MPVITNYAQIMCSLGKCRESLGSNRPSSATELGASSLCDTC